MKWSNPVCEGADPFLLRCGDAYYHYATLTPDQGFTVRSSRDLTHWEEHGFCLRRGDVAGNGSFWAPEVLERDGKFYMVYVADEHLGVATADSPLGPFTQTEKRFLDDRCAIDGHFFVDEEAASICISCASITETCCGAPKCGRICFPSIPIQPSFCCARRRNGKPGSGAYWRDPLSSGAARGTT